MALSDPRPDRGTAPTPDPTASDDGRCPWAAGTPRLRAYHDGEWGRPQHDERHLFEMLVLEGAQAGLSWSTVLERREGYRAACDGFDVEAVAAWDDARLQQLLGDSRIIRNRLKVRAARTNAWALLALTERHGPFSTWLWGWVGGAPLVRRPRTPADVLVTSDLGDRLSRDLRRRGFAFVGPTIVHSYLQAVGVVEEHLVGCPAKPVG